MPPNHPAPALAHQVSCLLWITLGICFVALGLSIGGGFGFSSFFVTPAAGGCTLIYNITLLAILYRDRNTDIQKAFPCTAHKAAIIFAWLLAVLWGAALVMICLVFGFFWEHRNGGDYDGRFLYPAFAELPFVFANTVAYVVLGLREIKERQAIFGMPETARWYQMGGKFQPLAPHAEGAKELAKEPSSV